MVEDSVTWESEHEVLLGASKASERPKVGPRFFRSNRYVCISLMSRSSWWSKRRSRKTVDVLPAPEQLLFPACTNI
jgi:hypothetical protein